MQATRASGVVISAALLLNVCVDACRQTTHKIFVEQGGKGVSLERFRTFLGRLQDGMLKLEFAHYDTQGEGWLGFVCLLGQR